MMQILFGLTLYHLLVGMVEHVSPRGTELANPPVANIDQVVKLCDKESAPEKAKFLRHSLSPS